MKVVLGTREDDAETPTETVDDLSDLGFRAVPVDEQLARRLDVKVGEGLLIAEVAPGTPAARAGLRPGQLLLSVDHDPVSDEAALRAALRDSAGTEALLLRVRDGGGTHYVVLERE